MSRQRYKLTIAYDGTDFCGWQRQEPPVGNSAPPPMSVGVMPAHGDEPSRYQMRTVQHVVEQAVCEVVRERVAVKGSSRTDAGVHSRGQVATFVCSSDEGDQLTSESNVSNTFCSRVHHSNVDVNSESENKLQEAKATTPLDSKSTIPKLRGAGWPLSRGVERLLRALNGKLPDDVQIVRAQAVPMAFDPSADTVSKLYSYSIHASKARALWNRRQVHQVFELLDVAAMHEAAQRLVGEHDFVSFAATGHGRLTTTRTVFSCDVVELPNDRAAIQEAGNVISNIPNISELDARVASAQQVHISICGNGFLWNMVRIIAGTLVEVGKRRIPPERITQIIAACDRRAAGPTLPPTGLCLEWIKFREGSDCASRSETQSDDVNLPTTREDAKYQ